MDSVLLKIRLEAKGETREAHESTLALGHLLSSPREHWELKKRAPLRKHGLREVLMTSASKNKNAQVLILSTF